MNLKEAEALGTRLAALVRDDGAEQAYALLAPVLGERTPFRLLDRIGQIVGTEPLPATNAFLEQVAAGRTEGGWAVIGSALGCQLDRDLEGAFARARAYALAADVWYAADILGERLPGPALVARFEPALAQLAAWREDPNRWVRRMVGVAAHFWAKRSRGAPGRQGQAGALLALLEPMFEEREMDAVKGVGWGLKTLGKHYPDLVTDWLAEQVVAHKRHPRAVMWRKAITYLSPDRRARLAS